MVTHKEALAEAMTTLLTTVDSAEPQLEAAIRAYLDARGLVMVPRELDEEGAIALALEDYTMFPRSLWKDMLAAAHDPFKDDAP